MTLGFVKTFAACLAFGGVALVAIVPGRAQFPTLPEGPNRALVAQVCGGCHEIEMVAISGRGEERWRLTVEEMTGYGLQLSPAERALILKYLTTYLPPR
jgi:mono/diheme cytochrome c family protein